MSRVWGTLREAPDELGSFAAGILQAGSPCAVATLWAVGDYPTFLLMLRFMQNALDEHRYSPARAMREATRWLRKATREELRTFASGVIGTQQLTHDYRHAIYWATTVVYGV